MLAHPQVAITKAYSGNNYDRTKPVIKAVHKWRAGEVSVQSLKSGRVARADTPCFAYRRSY